MSEDNLRANPDSTTPVRARNRQVDALRASHAEETPRKKSLSDKPAFSEGSLDAKRDAAIEDAGDVCVLPWDFFTEAIFGSSPITNADVNVVLREFKKTSNQTIVEGKFSAYEQDPKDIEDHEDAVFAPITDIFDGAVEITKPRMAKKKRSPTVNLVQKPHNSPSGEIDNRTRPDSYSNLIDPKDLASILSQYREGSWFSIFATLWSLNHILANDPRRRFALGLTIENTELRVWFACRSYVVVSETINFVTDTSRFIHFILTLAFSTPQELGLDTTMSQIEDIHGKPQYKMVVKGKTFVTIDIIANYRAAGICGTGTRVWLVYEEGFPESRYVLKDMWMPLHSLAEGEQLRRLHLRLEAVNHDAAHHPHDSFLVLLEDGFVTGNDTLSMLGGNDIPVDAPLEQMRQHAPRPSRGKSRTGLPPPPKRTPLFTGRKKIYHRKQYRIVFKDVGTTIYEIKFLSGIMDALSDATKALKLLHNLGLVHRDLSPGNIVVVDGVGKVLDLECLKVYLKDETDEVEICSAVKDHQTASSGFTAVEVEAQSYFFGSPGDVSLESLQTESRVVFNPLHDLESIIWIAIWALTYCSAETAVETSEAQSAVFDDCFGPQAIADTRHRMLTLQWRQPGLASYPPIFHDSIRILIPMLQQLTRQYSEFETTFDLTALKLDETYESFISGYSKMARALQDIPFVTPKSVEGARVRKPAKRSRDTEINEEKGDVGDTTGKVPAKKSKSVGSPSAAAGSSSTTSGPSLARRKSTRLTGKKT